MKLMLMLLFAFIAFSQNVFADKYCDSNSVPFLLYPTIEIKGILFTIDELCIEDNMVRTKNKVENVCTRFESTEAGLNCIEFSETVFETPIGYTASVCVEYQYFNEMHVCAKEARLLKTHSKIYKLPLVCMDQQAQFFEPISIIEFEIPNCN